jgi:hypothetical protein
MGEAMRSVSIRTGVAISSLILFQLFAGGAMGADDAYSQAVLTDPVCTIEGEAKCWSPAEVEDALSYVFCDGIGSDTSCLPVESLPMGAVGSVELPVQEPVQAVAAVKPESPKLDESGVPEFNAFEEGCDD